MANLFYLLNIRNMRDSFYLIYKNMKEINQTPSILAISIVLYTLPPKNKIELGFLYLNNYIYIYIFFYNYHPLFLTYLHLSCEINMIQS